ncbi:ATP-binding cassette domain-containing protein [Conexibacter stalactiti]|uniref:ATP-binding cassette domain-containing protein n=1 Tax=Conexibacter stalactiti TaxID=1940611 RepID=A0ABU4HMN0_9ACTN|nr:ATP-binding cassette domain-containing protein [Conexibacter stalactiti]MDW5594507.1 ATP-binding cassette domain-containing protein [Conexibacter stalactiti]MEC5035149.1 ATP-binding cassette domain-containing protein [Conexibacter stalactiti]
MSTTPRAVLRLTDVEKTYPGVRALKRVSFEVREGEVHALVGENGAGKSTLMAVAAGSTVPDSGTVEIDGTVLEDPTPAAAQAAGLAVVYQHTSVLDDLTVAENMAFGMPPQRRPSLGRARAWAAEKLAAIDIELDPGARVGELGVAERHLLEIAKAVVREPRVLVLDEPTESLTAAETEVLFARIQKIVATGAAVVYISHRLPEVKRIATRLSVLRDGEMRGTFDAAEVSEDQILQLIVGRSIERAFPDKRPADAGPAAPLLELRDFSGDRFHDVALTVGAGEIVGLAGVEGNGQRDALRALAGIESARGSVTVGGRGASVRDPRSAQAAGIVYLPGDRHEEGLFLDLSVRENTSLLSLGKVASGPVVRTARERATVAEQIRELTIKTPSEDTPVGSLSGGNQQKVLFARSTLKEPTVLLADEPTRGVDAGARVEIYRVMRAVADGGSCVVVVSSDALELQGLCDRVHVFSRGQIVRTLEGDDVTEEQITGAALTATSERRTLAERARGALRLRRFAAGDRAPALVLALLFILLAIYTTGRNEFFFSERSVSSMLLLASALAFIAFGQLLVLLTAGIDLSVGPLAGLVVVVLSFFFGIGSTGGEWMLGIVVVIAVAVAVGLTNGMLVRFVKLSPVLATLATYIVLQGVSLLLRPQPDGSLSPDFTDFLTQRVGGVPLAFVIAVVLAIGAEIALLRSRWGLQLRAVGSDETRAHRMGARVGVTVIGAYVGCALLTLLGGLMLSAQIGIGDPSAGINYTLTSITAVVLGGASIFGGRGSFVGALLGALLLQEIATATPFLGLDQSWQYFLPGILILFAAGAYSRARGVKTSALAAPGGA